MAHRASQTWSSDGLPEGALFQADHAQGLLVEQEGHCQQSAGTRRSHGNAIEGSCLQ